MVSNSETESAATSEGNDYLVGNATSLFAIRDLRLRVWPILATIVLGWLVVIPSGYVYFWFLRHTSEARRDAMPWLGLYLNHAVMVGVALLLIAILNKGRFGEYGLQWPKRKAYAWAAVAWGAFFGVLMTVVDYLPEIVKHRPPPDHLALTAASLAGWLGVEFIYVGPTEEIPFRGLMLTYLMQRTSGRVRLGKYEMHVAGVILAVLFALAHLSSFWQGRFWMALGQQIYAFALGILYAYWREKSGSLWAPILGHNFSDGVEYSLMFLMTWLWR
jgi:membrane protease YdiL (CAAX protease family)